MIILRRAGIALVSVVAVAVLGGCTSDTDGVAVSEAASDSTTSTTTSSTTSASATTGSASVDLEVDVAPGDCIVLGGTVDNATIDYAECGSNTANYKVVDVVESSDECASDIDQTYYESFSNLEVGALCLDIDWKVGDCMDLGGEDPQRVDCSSSAVQGEKVTEILTDTADVNDCASSEGGFVYSEREFVVCTDSF